jgi:hypothetical protein
MNETTKCCLCGKEIPTWGSKNPYPFGSVGKDERCCERCFSEKVIRTRQIMVGEVEEETKRIVVDLDEIEVMKLERIREIFNEDPEVSHTFTLEEVAHDLLSDAIIERARSLS